MKDIKEVRILYMGTPSMSAAVLESLLKYGYNVVGVVAQEDQYVGRKHILEKVPTKVVAEAHNIPVFQPHKIREDFSFVNKINPDLILTMAYGQIVPVGLLELPPLGCINLHGSILPKYRGAAPIQRAIMEGEKETGITLMEMAEGMDSGKMYSFEKVTIEESDNYTSLVQKLVLACDTIIQRDLPKYIAGELSGIEQDETKVTIAKKIKPEDEKLSLDLDTKSFLNYLRGLSNEPGGYVILDNKKFKIFKAHKVNENVNMEAGEITVEKVVTLQLKDAQIVLDEVQLEGKKRMDGKSFANGSKIYNHYKVN
ncbi:MAG: methionyl-tRNA formyltransferase [Bacilli bacterium]|nr:methionyl-tRNA formyltransferase [Bacilli bacterium]